MTAGWLLKRVTTGSSSKPSTMSPMSASVRRVPSGRESTTISAKSAPTYAWPLVRISTSPPGVRMEPAGRSSEARLTASATDSSVSPYCCSVDSEISMDTS